MHKFFFTAILATLTLLCSCQNISDDFEGSGTINSWYGDDCQLTQPFQNPVKQGVNTSNNVLKYEDVGGNYANVGFDLGRNFDMNKEHTFTLKVYVSSASLTGNQPNQISLKLQDGSIAQPWTTQSEIIQTLKTDTWQEVEFNFRDGKFINLDAGSADPIDRSDFNRVVIQLNGEGNNDKVLAYVDDFFVSDKRDTTTGGSGKVYNRLVWSDEFDGSGALDQSKWYHQTLLPNGQSWFNGEIQHYTNRTDNSYQANGDLYIVAKKERFTDQGVTKDYTSARLNSKYAFTYGRVEVRGKLPLGTGTWPAIWMLGKNIDEKGGYWQPQYGNTPWPACGEIDIMEHWGHNPNYVQSAIHTPSSHGGTINKGGKALQDVKNEYHVYAMDWYEDKIVFSIDSQDIYTYEPDVKDASTWPFTEDQYILLNIAIEPSIEATFNQGEMIIDYVRVYQESEDSETSISEQMNAANDVTVFPNPASDLLHIRLDAQDEFSVVLYSLNGQIVQSIEKAISRSAYLPISELTNGMYYLRVTGNTIDKKLPVIIQH